MSKKVSQSQHKCSIIIPTYNAEADLPYLLSTINSLSDSDDFEIIVIDSGSTDGTVERAKQFDIKLVQIDPLEFNHGRTRNLAASMSGGEFLFFFTQDARPLRPDYFEVMVQSLERENAAAGFARQVARPDASPLVKRDVANWLAGSEERRIIEFESITDFCQMPPIERYLSCIFDNVASVIRRDVWEKVPIPDALYGEDIEWGLRAISNGCKIVYEPDAVVEHSHDRPPAYTYKRTLIDHYRLNELFGVRTVPSRFSALRGWVGKTSRDWAWLLANPSMNYSWMHDFVNAPRHAWASNWGQYEGAKRSAMGLPPLKQYGV